MTQRSNIVGKLKVLGFIVGGLAGLGLVFAVVDEVTQKAPMVLLALWCGVPCTAWVISGIANLSAKSLRSLRVLLMIMAVAISIYLFTDYDTLSDVINGRPRDSYEGRPDAAYSEDGDPLGRDVSSKSWDVKLNVWADRLLKVALIIAVPALTWTGITRVIRKKESEGDNSKDSSHVENINVSQELNPTELFRKHEGEDFSRWSLAELEILKDKLVDRGLVKDWDNQHFSCSASVLWHKLSESEKFTFCSLCYQTCLKLHCDDQGKYFCVNVPAEDSSDVSAEHQVYVFGKSQRQPGNRKGSNSDVSQPVEKLRLLGNTLGQANRPNIQSLITKGFSRTECLIIVFYYYEDMTLKEIGEVLGLSESKVAQMHSSILRRLKDNLGGPQKGAGSA